MRRALVSSALLLVVAGCQEKRKPPPASWSAAEPTASAAPAGTEPPPAAVAYPPGMAPPEDAGADAAPPAPKTGVCAFDESGYDGQDTKSNEKMVVKVKADRIVAAEYSYRGSYALDGKTDRLDIPLVENRWIELELPMTTGTRKFQVKVRGDVADFKGVATEGVEGDCQWEKPAPEKERKKKK